MFRKRLLAVLLSLGMVVQPFSAYVYAEEWVTGEVTEECTKRETVMSTESKELFKATDEESDVVVQSDDKLNDELAIKSDSIKSDSSNDKTGVTSLWPMNVTTQDEECVGVGEDDADRLASMSQSEYDSKMNGFINDGRWKNGVSWPKNGCVLYSYKWVDYMYGLDGPARGTKYTGTSNIRSGDVLRLSCGHTIIVLKRDGNSLYTAEGDFSRKVRITDSAYSITGSGKIHEKVTGGDYGLTHGYHYVDIVDNRDTEAPRVSEERRENVTSTGYDVYCRATDNVGVTCVKFPTWTVANNQADITWENGERISGSAQDGYYKYHVNIAKYGNRKGQYATHIYAYDAAGNTSGGGNPGDTVIKAEVQAPTILDLSDRNVKLQTTGSSTWISIDGSGFSRYSSSTDYTLNAAGNHTIRAYSQDSEGNKSVEVSRTLYVGKSETPGRKVDETPTASLVTLTKSNANSVIWYSINGGGYQKYTSQIRRTENTTIKYYSTRTGCVQSDVSEFQLKVTAPDKPVAELGNKESRIGIGDVIMVKLDKQSKAGKYICTFKRDDTDFYTVESEDNNISFKTETAGKYTITAIAQNSFGESETSNALNIMVMPNVTVRFEDWDGSLLDDPIELKWGGSVSDRVPKAPSREGYDFQGWDGTFTNITEDTVIKAKYEIKVFTVNFRNLNGDNNTLVKTERVEWGSSAHEPDMTSYIPAPGYIFAGWCVDKNSACEDYKCVKGNMTLYASYAWENSNLTMATGWMSVTCKKNNIGEQYYEAIATLTCNPDLDSNARAVLKLSTAEGKTVAVKTEDIQLAAGETSKFLQFGINEDLDASKASLYIVGFKNQKTAGTLAKVAEVDITRQVYYGEWSDWSETKPEADNIGTKKQYRWNTRETVERTDTRTLSGYKLVSTDTNVGGWSSWQDGAISEINNDSRKREVQTRDVVTGTYYKYGHYCGKTRQGWETFPWSSSAFVSNAAYHEIGTFEENDSRLTYMGVASDTGAQNWTYYPNGSLYRCSNTCYRWYRMGDPTHTYKKQYRYRDTTYVYHFEKVSEYGQWSDTKPTSYYQLQERTLYRGRNEIDWAALDEKNDTEKIHVEGKLENAGDVADKIATAFVYKQTNTDPLQEQIEYMQEVKIGADNSYELDIFPRENLSAETGDFIIAFALEGATRLINAKILPAPKATYTVSFIADGKLISTQSVEAGNSAEVPEAPVLAGKKFVRWNTSTTNIREDLEIEAVYQEASCAVVYVDKLNGTVDLVRANYNDPISKDYPEAPEGYKCLGWDAATVSGDMIVNALYEKRDYTVTFMDATGQNVVEKKTCSYGGSVLPPSYEYMTAGEGQRITGWSLEPDWRHVTDDIIVYPIVEYEKTASMPYSTVGNTELSYLKYTDYEIEPVYPMFDLNSDADGAQIYYTTDGSDPEMFEEHTEEEHDACGESADGDGLSTNAMLYTGPIKITGDVTIKAISVEDGKNISEIAQFPITLEEIQSTVDKYDDSGDNDDDWFIFFGDDEISSAVDSDKQYSKNLTPLEKARIMGLGSVNDTDALVSFGKSYALSISGNEAQVTVAKGNKFRLDGAKGTFTLKDPTKKKLVSVNRKGVVKAKNGTGEEYVDIIYQKDGQTCDLKVRVIIPSISSNDLQINKLTATANAGQKIDICLDVPLNALYDRINTKNKGAVSDLAVSFCSDERYHITGNAVGKGKVTIPIYVNGKKFSVKIKVKK